MANLRVDLGWGAWPGSTSIILPLREVGQRESNLVRCTGLASIASINDGGFVAGVDSKVIVTHSGLFLFGVSVREKGSRESKGERRKGGFDGELENYPSFFVPFYMAGRLPNQRDNLAFIFQDSRRENGTMSPRHMDGYRIPTRSTPSTERG